MLCIWPVGQASRYDGKILKQPPKDHGIYRQRCGQDERHGQEHLLSFRPIIDLGQGMPRFHQGSLDLYFCNARGPFTFDSRLPDGRPIYPANRPHNVTPMGLEIPRWRWHAVSILAARAPHNQHEDHGRPVNG